jgi:hypothetical protein
MQRCSRVLRRSWPHWFSDGEAIVSAAGMLPPRKSVETQRISAINRLRLVIFRLEKRVNATCASKYSAVPSFRAAYVLRARQSAPVRRRRTLLGLVNAKN